MGGFKMLKVRVKLPKNRPGNWWAMTVNLPCRPPLFTFRNAFCISSEDQKHRRTSYALTQNKKSGHKSNIMFEVVFSKHCQFKAEDIEIIWDESFPAQKFPQVSSIPQMKNREIKSMLRARESMPCKLSGNCHSTNSSISRIQLVNDFPFQGELLDFVCTPLVSNKRSFYAL